MNFDIKNEDAFEAEGRKATKSTTPQHVSADNTNVVNNELPSQADSRKEPAEPVAENSSKPASTASFAAKRKRAKFSSFRKTARGKKNSGLDWLNHGLYSHVVPDLELPEFNAVRAALGNQLPPSSAFQKIAFELIQGWVRSCKKAEQMEMERLDTRPAPRDEAGASDGNPSEWVVTDRPYASGRKGRKQALSLLDAFERDVRAMAGFVRESWKEPLSQCFGPEFFDLLIQWSQEKCEVLFVARALDYHEKHFSAPVREDWNEEEKKKDREARAWIKEQIDRLPWLEQRFEMILKLIAEKRRHLCEIDALDRSAGSAGANTGERTNTVKVAPLGLTEAMRGLQEAVDWYLWLRENDL